MKKIITLITVLCLTVALALPVFATSFTPSIEQKGAPDVITTQDDKGETVVAVIRYPNGDEVIGVPDGKLVVTPISNISTASFSIKNNLQFAQNKLKTATYIGEVVPEFDTQLKAVSPDKDPKDFVVKDLFDVSVVGDYVEYLKNNNTITITFNANLKSDDVFVPIQYITETSTWEVIPTSNIKRNSDGTVDITLTKLGILAFSVESTNTDSSAPVSPQTGVNTTAFVFAGVILILSGSAIAVKANTKKAKEDR